MNLPSLRLKDSNLSSKEKVAKRQAIITSALGSKLNSLYRISDLPDSVEEKNCENWLGSVSLPVGIAGPIGIITEGKSQQRQKNNQKMTEYYIPLATTEGALVASVSRGSKAILKTGGSKIIVEKKGMTRAPVFECENGTQAMKLVDFLEKNVAEIKKIAEDTSNHLKYLTHQTFIRGRHVYVRFVFDTDQAMGMNMTTIATQAIAIFIEKNVEGVKLLALSSNVCTDKKDNLVNSVLGRGYWAQAEIILPEKIISEILKTKIDKLLKTHLQKNLIGSNIAGSFSQNAQVANVVAGIFIATGQDPAHVIEASKAFLSLEKVTGGLYASLTLPNLNMGTIGGGTYLPAQSEARKLIGGGKDIEAEELVRLTAGACLAGELSLLASLSEHTLACAHQKLGR